MVDKVDYSKIQLDFPTIMKKLHEIALENARRVRSDILLDNQAFNDENGTFNGAGEYLIIVKPRDEGDVPDSEKDAYLKFVKEYVKYFVGEDAAKLVKKEDLQPYGASSGQDEEAQGGENAETDENAEKSEKNTDEKTAPVSESTMFFISKSDRMLTEAIDFMFEADGDESTEKNTQTGFVLEYAIDIAGQQRKSLGEIFKRKTKGFFGGMMADLQNLEIKTKGGDSIAIGQLFDPAKWKEAVGAVDINIKTVDNNVENIIRNDFPRSSAIARVYDRESLVNALNRQGKLTEEIRKKIDSAKYSLTIQVEKRDNAFEQFTKEKIADICTRAFGTAMNLTNRNKVTADDVIQIDDWSSEYKTRSIYDRRGGDSRDDTSSTGRPSTTKESFGNFILGGTVLESLMRDLFDEDCGVDLVLESDFDDLKSIRGELNRIGMDNIHDRLDEIRKYYKEEMAKLRDDFKRGELPDSQPFVDFQKTTGGKFKTKEDFAKYLLGRRYMQPDDNSTIFKKLIGSKGDKNPTWASSDSVEKCIELLDRYFGKDVDDSDVGNYDNLIQAKALLNALKRISGDIDEQSNISVQFWYKDPTNRNANPHIISTLVGGEDILGNIDVGPINDIAPEYEGYILSGWNPDPNDFGPENIGKNRIVKTNAMYVSDDDEIVADFVVKSPLSANSPIETLTSLTALPGEFNKLSAQFPDVSEPRFKDRYDKYTFKGWNPNPNSLSADGQVSAVFELDSEDDKGNYNVLFIIPHKRLTSQNRPNKEEQYDDGTVRARTSDEPYKPSDMRM